MVYDLNKEPKEAEDLTVRLPVFVNEGRPRQAAWAQLQKIYQNRLQATDNENRGQK